MTFMLKVLGVSLIFEILCCDAEKRLMIGEPHPNNDIGDHSMKLRVVKREASNGRSDKFIYLRKIMKWIELCPRKFLHC